MDKLKNVDIKVWLRVIVFVVLAIATMLAGAGVISEVPTEDAIALAVTGGLTIASAAWNAWKNNDFTGVAQLAGKIFTILKNNGGELTEEAIEEIKALEAEEEKVKNAKHAK